MKKFTKRLFKYQLLILFISLVRLPIQGLELGSIEKERLNTFARYAYSTRETLYNTYELSIDCIKNNIPGDFVECGVAGGAQVAAMGYALQMLRANIRVHLFDSFEGIPLAGPNDTVQPGVGPIKHSVKVEKLDNLLVSSNNIYPELGNASKYSIEQVKNHMNSFGIESNSLVYHKGWFQNTLPTDAAKISKISLLRLDGDLYESTKVCLEYLYPKISKGGYIIIDDYALSGCRKAVDEYLNKHKITPKIISIHGGEGPVYWKIQ